MIGYSETIRRWAMRTERVGTLADADGTGEIGLNAGEIGRRLAVRFTLRRRNDMVADARFQVFGCGFTIAACAVAADLAVGRTLDEVLSIDAAMIDRTLEGLPSERGYCATLAAEALRAAVVDARAENDKRPDRGRSVTVAQEHGPALSAADPCYRALMDSAAPANVAAEDRRLFAGLLALAARETGGVAPALGLAEGDLRELLATFFPSADPAPFLSRTEPAAAPAPRNDEVLAIILAHVPRDETGREMPVAGWLARILEARSRLPGHLWVAMGLFERPELTAAIRRHLPTLAQANDKGMRWKRFLFKQVCERHGAALCPAPDCGVCSDYALCFAPED